MPIYEYVCPKCKNKFELMRPSAKADEPAACPACGLASKRIFSRFASVTKDSSGATAPVAGTGGGCSSCGSSSCATCGG
jgi:putative FmdB family regulatory protein